LYFDKNIKKAYDSSTFALSLYLLIDLEHTSIFTASDTILKTDFYCLTFQINAFLHEILFALAKQRCR